MFDYNTNLIVFHILRAECCAPALKIKDLIEIRTSSKLPFTLRINYILKIFHKNFNLIPLQYQQLLSNFNTFIQYVSWYEIDNIAYAYILSTYDLLDEDFEKSITCPKCDYKFKSKISMEEFVSLKTVKIWDKQEPYYNYVFKFEHLFDNVEIQADFYIPNIFEFLRKLRTLNNETIRINLEKYGDYLDDFTLITFHTKRIIVTDKITNEKVTLTLPNDIYDFYANISAEMFNIIYRFYKENVEIYRPRFVKELTCPNCKNIISLKLYPINEFINLTSKTHNIKVLEENIDLFTSLYLTTNKHFVNLGDFFNLPYPLFIKISKKFYELFDKERKILKRKLKSNRISKTILNEEY